MNCTTRNLLSLILLVILLLQGTVSEAQINQHELSVTAELINKTTVKLTVKNSSASEQILQIMSCSWQDNWRTDNPDFWELRGLACDKNSPKKTVLKPSESISFSENLGKPAISAHKIRVKFGFSKNCFNHHYSLQKIRKNGDDVWWSNAILL